MRHFPPAYHRPQLDTAAIGHSRVPDYPVWVDPASTESFRTQRTLADVRRLVSSLQYSVHGTAAALRFSDAQLATMRTRIRALTVHLALADSLAAVTDDEIGFITQLEQELHL